MRTILNLICLGLAMVCLYGCGYSEADHARAVESGVEVMLWPKQMDELLGNTEHFITHYGFSGEPTTWNSQVYFGGRYVLKMQISVQINYRRNKVIGTPANPKFYLYEIEKVVPSNGGMNITYSGQWRFDEGQWTKLVESGGDWGSIEIPVEEVDEPVMGFEEYVRRRTGRGIKKPD